MTVEIRPLRTEEELELAIRLEASCYPPAAAASPEAFRYRWERFPSYFLSAWDGPQLTGIANGVLTNARDCSDVGLKKTHGGTPDGERLCILTVAVAAERRGRGIGAALLRAPAGCGRIRRAPRRHADVPAAADRLVPASRLPGNRRRLRRTWRHTLA
ncbi:GNAT family N-acetyltransferase [Cohnella laeviribosi]|uniref:GNAT family N-acetyltransferase n=1 Tax=Cohnella laeviribosi TaxID=380174 RepID=UPI0003A9B470|nr:GNAT family N-acetyltransferase [Cohnella laeviribosi]